jgi:hypothetical protein
MKRKKCIIKLRYETNLGEVLCGIELLKVTLYITTRKSYLHKEHL